MKKLFNFIHEHQAAGYLRVWGLNGLFLCHRANPNTVDLAGKFAILFKFDAHDSSRHETKNFSLGSKRIIFLSESFLAPAFSNSQPKQIFVTEELMCLRSIYRSKPGKISKMTEVMCKVENWLKNIEYVLFFPLERKWNLRRIVWVVLDQNLSRVTGLCHGFLALCKNTFSHL